MKTKYFLDAYCCVCFIPVSIYHQEYDYAFGNVDVGQSFIHGGCHGQSISHLQCDVHIWFYNPHFFALCRISSCHSAHSGIFLPHGLPMGMTYGEASPDGRGCNTLVTLGRRFFLEKEVQMWY